MKDKPVGYEADKKGLLCAANSWLAGGPLRGLFVWLL